MYGLYYILVYIVFFFIFVNIMFCYRIFEVFWYLFIGICCWCLICVFGVYIFEYVKYVLDILILLGF